MLAVLPTADPSVVGDVAAALTALGVTEAERAEIWTALLAVLPTADPRAVGDVVAALRSVSPPKVWLAWLAGVE